MPDADSRPNVLFVLTDQERYDCSAPDESRIKTPTMDRLSNEGLRFERAFTPISICTSARASLLTGLFPHGHGMLNNSHEADAIRPNLPEERPTFSKKLKEAGYDLTYTGKWHVGRDQRPEKFGFSYFGGSDEHHDPDLDDEFRKYREEELGVPLDVDLEEKVYTRGGKENGTLVAAKTPVDVEATRDYFIAKKTIEAIEAHATGDRDEPFFHWTNFYGPHHPWVVPELYASMYDPDDIELLGSYAETYEKKPQVHENYLHYRGVSDFDWETWAEVIAKYRGFVTMIDVQLKRILEALEKHGLAEKTIVVHASDHGSFVGRHRQFNKGPLMYDDTYRIPLQIRMPEDFNSKPKKEIESKPEPGCKTPVHLHDLAATFLEMADVEVPESFDSRSLVPLLENGEDGSENAADAPASWPDSVFGQYYGDEFGLYTQRMVRTNRYKYVYNGPDVDELYDLEADPAELRNLIEHPYYADTRQEMRNRLIDWMEKTEDPNRKWVPGVLTDAAADD